MDQPRPTRTMSDMAPRRMDGFARPAGSGPRPQPAPRPARPQAPAPRPQASQRPVAPAPRPAEAAPAARRSPASPATRASQPVRRPAQADPQAGDAFGLREPERPRKGGGVMAVVVQFVLGLMIIVGVAALVVWLWMKYYQA